MSWPGHPDSLLLCKAGAPNISRGLILFSIPSPCVLVLLDLVHVLCILSSSFMEDLPSSLTDAVEDTCSDNDSYQISLIHLEVCTTRDYQHEMAKGTHHHHEVPAHAVDEVLLLVAPAVPASSARTGWRS